MLIANAVERCSEQSPQKVGKKMRKDSGSLIVKHPNTPEGASVWRWNGRRTVVLDPKIQPRDSGFAVLYFVEGHDLCVRSGVTDLQNMLQISDSYDRNFALEQYARWSKENGKVIAEKKLQTEFTIEAPPHPRKKCPQCEGQPTWFDAINKATYGVIAEGPNIIWRCQHCSGNGYVVDVL